MQQKLFNQIKQQELSNFETEQSKQKLIEKVNSEQYPCVKKQPYKCSHLNKIRCPKDHNVVLGCTNKKCFSFPFVCKNYQECHSCNNEHRECFTFVKADRLIQKVYSKKNKPQKVAEYITKSFDKWIDMISETMQRIQETLEWYGLSKNQYQLAKFIQKGQNDKITGQKLYLVSKQLEQVQKDPNTQEEMFQQLEKQFKIAQTELNKNLSMFEDIIKQSNEGKIKHKTFKVLCPTWKFNKDYKQSNNFTFQNEQNLLIKCADPGRYHHIIGTTPFDQKSQSQFSIMIKQSIQNCIMFGISPDSISRSDSHYDPNCVSYWGFNGTIWKNGSSQTAGEKFDVGDIITIKYQPQHKRVVWQKNYHQVSQSPLNQQVTKKKLYPVYGLLANADKIMIWKQYKQ